MGISSGFWPKRSGSPHRGLDVLLDAFPCHLAVELGRSPRLEARTLDIGPG
jgi:hypothetical protein